MNDQLCRSTVFEGNCGEIRHMLFFRDDRGAHYPVTRIERIGVPETDPNNKTSWNHSVALAGGGSVQVHRDEVFRILASGQAVAAAPGYSVIHVDGDNVLKSPIIAWLVGSDGTAAPVTPDGLNDGLDTIPSILTPDNQVIRPGDRTWRTLLEYLDDPERPTFS